MVVMAILAILVSIAVPLYTGHIERATQKVCNVNCLQLERMYHVYLLMENKDHTAYVFDEFLQKYEKNLCPANGDIKYVNGNVRCMLHSEDEGNGNDDDEDDGSVPFL
jgi:Tfp pilus assembly protein PilE